MTDFDFQVLELCLELQQRLYIQQLLALLSSDLLVRGISIACGQTMLKWRVPYGRLITRERGILRLKSAERKERTKEGRKVGEREKVIWRKCTSL